MTSWRKTRDAIHNAESDRGATVAEDRYDGRGEATDAGGGISAEGLLMSEVNRVAREATSAADRLVAEAKARLAELREPR